MENKYLAPSSNNRPFIGQPLNASPNQPVKSGFPTRNDLWREGGKSATQTPQPQAPAAYRPAPQRAFPPPVYRPQQIGNASAQRKWSTDLRIETRPAPPVYRPASQGLQSKTAAMVQGSSKPGVALARKSSFLITAGVDAGFSHTHRGTAPPVYRPFQAAPEHAKAISLTVQLSRKSNPEKKEEQKKKKQEKESKLKSREDRNEFRFNQYQTPNKNQEVQKERLKKVKDLSKKNKNIAHGFGSSGSKTSNKFTSYMKDINVKSNKKVISENEIISFTKKEKKGVKGFKSSTPVHQWKIKAKNVAGFNKDRKSAIEAYVEFCLRSELGKDFRFSEETFRKWAEEWAAEEWEEIVILDEHPEKEFKKNNDEDDGNDKGSNFNNNNSGVETLVN